MSAVQGPSVPPQGRQSRHDAEDAARPLGPKAAALHARRQRHNSVKAASAAAERGREQPGRLALASEDGAFTFVLRPSHWGLYVERTQRRPLDKHIVQSMVFDSVDTFFRWCEADAVRFDHPILYTRLRRHGDEALGATR